MDRAFLESLGLEESAIDAVLEAQLRQLLAQLLLKTRPGSEQPHARLDFQQQGSGVIQTDMGAEAVGPGGKKMLPVQNLLFVVIGHGKTAGQGLGGGQAHARLQAKLAGRRVECPDHPARYRSRCQNQRLVMILPAALHAIQRQLREQYAGPAHALPQRYRSGSGQSSAAFQYPHLTRPGIHRQPQCGGGWVGGCIH